MSTHVLSKGANVAVHPRTGADARVQAVVRWSDPLGAADVDVSALLLGPHRRVRSDDDFVFYNSPAGGGGSVRLVGKRTDERAGEDRIAVDLEALPPDVETVVIAASLDAEDGSGFGRLPSLGIVVVDAGGDQRVQFDIEGAGPETAIVLGEFYLRGDDWKFRAIGQGWDSGLAGLATDYGIHVDDTAGAATEPDPAADAEDVPPVAAPPDAADEAEELVPVPVDEIGIDEVLTTESWTIAPAAAESPGLTMHDSAPATAGVRTRKKRIPVTAVAPLTLAADPHWHPARLFSITGMSGSAHEQEQRATSTLLASMMAVRDFGRALVSRFGGPAGRIETYPEVPFTLQDGSTVRPDGVIRVARAGRVWTGLLETKTGTNALYVEQVERYLDLAVQEGYDAVITLSNDLVPAGGDHPLKVDGRKLRKVSLHHIAWSEVLHETRMQLAYRGVDDQLEAWLLYEFIRYLEHPKSGAAGFDDMGPAWVPVRDAIAHVQRPNMQKAGTVVRSWDKLVRHLCLRLTSTFGVDVSTVMPRMFAADPAARTAAAVARLVNDGQLVATLRIPGAAGSMSMIADLRSMHIRTSVDIGAPREGGPRSRVGWLLRQLAGAPGTTEIEVGFAGRGPNSSASLKSAQGNIAILLPDPAADVRSFRVSLSASLGPKRSGNKQAFIPSVNAAVDLFHAQVVSSIRSAPSG